MAKRENGIDREETPRAGERRRRAPRASGRRRSGWAALAAGLLLLAVDLARPPERQVTAWLLLGGIDLYQATLSEAMPRLGVRCRFEPTCSRYAEAVIRRDGALVGTGRALARLARCGPWTPAGTHDPPG